MSRRSLIQATVLLGIGVLILYGLLRTVHPDRVATAIRGANPSWIAIGMAGYLAFIVIRGWRWLVILRASAPAAALGDATAVTAIGFALNAVSPFKLGELLRIGAIAPRARIGVGEATATDVVERVLDVLALLLIAVAAAAVSGAGSNSFGLWGGVAVVSLASLAIGALAFLMVSYPQRTLAVIDRIATRLPARVAAFVDRFAASVLKGFASLRSPRRLATAALLSVPVWLCIDVGLMAVFRALTPQLAFPTLLLACTIFILSQAISITPGSVGTYEGFFLLVLSTFGAGPAALVTAAAVLSHVGNIAALLLAGAAGALCAHDERLRDPRARHRGRSAPAGCGGVPVPVRRDGPRGGAPDRALHRVPGPVSRPPRRGPTADHPPGPVLEFRAMVRARKPVAVGGGRIVHRRPARGDR